MSVIWIFGGKDFSASETFSIINWLLNLIFPGWPQAHPEAIHAIHIITRKIAHFLEYGILSILWYRALESGNRYRWAALFSLLYASLDEYRQSFLPSRTGSIEDAGIDFIGVLAARYLIAVQPSRPRRKCNL